jgi:hypothetical protein
VEKTYFNSELLDDGRSSGLGRVVEDLVDSLVDDLGRHGGSEDDGSLLVAGLGPEVGSGLSTGELSPDVDVVYGLVDCSLIGSKVGTREAGEAMEGVMVSMG